MARKLETERLLDMEDLEGLFHIRSRWVFARSIPACQARHEIRAHEPRDTDPGREPEDKNNPAE